MQRLQHLSSGQSALGVFNLMLSSREDEQLTVFGHRAEQESKLVNKLKYFCCVSALWVWGSANGSTTTSITPNCMFNYFPRPGPLMGRIFRHQEDAVVLEEGIAWMGYKALDVGVMGTVDLNGSGWDVPQTKRAKNRRAASQTTAWQQHGQEEIPV